MPFLYLEHDQVLTNRGVAESTVRDKVVHRLRRSSLDVEQCPQGNPGQPGHRLVAGAVPILHC
jgi:Mn-dependent DtxR family transcriptional regulator